MKIWLLKFCHAIGLTNLNDKDVERYAFISRLDSITFTDVPIVKANKSIPVNIIQSTAVMIIHGH